MAIQSNGKEGCPCIDSAGTLSSFPDRQCRLPTGEDGIQLTLGGSCVAFSYGSSRCLQHDLVHDPKCHVDEAGDHIVSAHCFRPWCYVDVDSCRGKSHERVFRSSYFSFESGVNLFYSYSTCNSTADDWFAAESEIVGNKALGRVTLKAAIPTYQGQMMYKRNPNNTDEILSVTGAEYYDDSIPFEGAYPNYIKQIVEISKGDIQNITFTHRSKASSLVHPTSSYTASVQDIQDGLIDMAIGPFWVTAQRLKMATFTLPIVYDKTFLVIPRPGEKDTLNDQIKKVLAPFSIELWALVLVIIVAAALLSVWFSDRTKASMLGNDRRIAMQGHVPNARRRKIAYARLALDSFLQKGLFFCSAGVEQDEGGSLPNQLLMFGFGFFILIAVSAYVANLAAFLTLSSTDAIKTIDGAVAAGMTICAHPAIEAELKIAWPNANFYFHESGNEFNGMLEEDYDSGKCRVLAVGWEDTGYDATYLEKLCARNLVYTESVVAEIPIAFPIRSPLAAGFSYWIYQGDRNHGTSIKAAINEEFTQQITCDVHYSEGDIEASEYAEITVKNMFFPLILFSVCAAIAVLLQVIHHYSIKTGRQSLVGRRSTLNLVTNSTSSRKSRRRSDDSEARTGHRISQWIGSRRRSDGNEPPGPKQDDDGDEGDYEEGCSGTNNGLGNTTTIMVGTIQPENISDFEMKEDPEAYQPQVRFSL